MAPQNPRRRSNNLDALRLLFAIAVIYSHSFPLAKGKEYGDELHQLSETTASIGALAVAGFFILSGYLISGSWERSASLADYLRKRMLRIFPGYIAAALVCLFVVLPFAGLTSAAFWPVAGEFAKIGQGTHPALFADNPLPAVPNGSLWTIRYEFWCYVALAIVGLTGALRSRWTSIALLIASLGYLFLISAGRGVIFNLPLIGTSEDWSRFACYFTAGAVFYAWRKTIPRSAPLALLCVVGFAGAVLLKQHAVVVAATSVLGSYLCVWLGFHPRVKSDWVTRYGDLSYGAYLYAFPIQQLLARYIPGITPLAMFALATPLALLAALASWHFVEKRWLPAQRVAKTEHRDEAIERPKEPEATGQIA